MSLLPETEIILKKLDGRFGEASILQKELDEHNGMRPSILRRILSHPALGLGVCVSGLLMVIATSQDGSNNTPPNKDYAAQNNATYNEEHGAVNRQSKEYFDRYGIKPY